MCVHAYLTSLTDRAALAAPLRSVLLSIEDHSFAALAAMSTSAMLEDESCPDIPDFPNSLSLTIPSPEATSNDPDKPSFDKDKKSKSSKLLHPVDFGNFLFFLFSWR